MNSKKIISCKTALTPVLLSGVRMNTANTIFLGAISLLNALPAAAQWPYPVPPDTAIHSEVHEDHAVGKALLIIACFVLSGSAILSFCVGMAYLIHLIYKRCEAGLDCCDNLPSEDPKPSPSPTELTPLASTDA